MLDIDPAVKPDICCDAKDMRKLPRAKYDAVFCSHNLEHFYKHEVPSVLDGMFHVLKPAGFVHIRVPDLAELFEQIVNGNLDIDDTWYVCGGGPIKFHDVLYGWGKQMANGNLFYAHRCGFTSKSLAKALRAAGFKTVMVARDSGNLHAYAFKGNPTEQQRRSLGV